MDLLGQSIVDRSHKLFAELAQLGDASRIETINALRRELSKHSPFRAEPVDCVLWVASESVEANDYNPNVVAPPEMRLLEHSITEDGYTQPIVTWVDEQERREVVDGFHRWRVGTECKRVRQRIRGYLPVTTVNTERIDRGDRIAATIRHNRARGKHQVGAMSEIVIELKRRNWSDKKIGRDLGMDPDEVLRLSQIAGLAEMFADREFSEAWEAVDTTDADAIDQDDDLTVEGEEMAEASSPTKPRKAKKKCPADADGWEHRTESRSELPASIHGTAARLNRAPGASQWRWTVYAQPVQTGFAENRDDAKREAEQCIASLK